MVVATGWWCIGEVAEEVAAEVEEVVAVVVEVCGPPWWWRSGDCEVLSVGSRDCRTEWAAWVLEE